MKETINIFDIVTNTASRGNYELPKPELLFLSQLMDLFVQSNKSINVKLAALTLNLGGFRVELSPDSDSNIDMNMDE